MLHVSVFYTFACTFPSSTTHRKTGTGGVEEMQTMVIPNQIYYVSALEASGGVGRGLGGGSVGAGLGRPVEGWIKGERERERDAREVLFLFWVFNTRGF